MPLAPMGNGYMLVWSVTGIRQAGVNGKSHRLGLGRRRLDNTYVEGKLS